MALQIPIPLKDRPEDLLQTVRDALCIQMAAVGGCAEIKCSECVLGETAMEEQPHYFKAVLNAISKQVMEAPE